MKNLKVLDRHAVAEIITQSKADILRVWEIESRKRVDAAKAQSRVDLRDSLPEFIDQLIRTLRSADPYLQAYNNTQVARAHAEDRSTQPEYGLDEVIFEYFLLRSTIVATVEAVGLIESGARQIIHHFVDRNIGAAALRYMELEMESKVAHAKQLENARLEAERASKAKSAFLANMSHEIRTPLGAITGFVGLLRDSELSREEVENYLTIIDRNSQHLSRIVDDILDLTKVEAGKMIIEALQFSLFEFLADFSSLAGMKARENSITFEFRAETLLPEFIVCDPTRLRQILSNVVGNAIKFTEKGKVTLSVSFKDNRMHFRVEDTGRGIPPEQIENLFQVFAQADSSTTRKYGGTGLGLVLTKKLSEALGGEFKLSASEPGKGSLFEAVIPVGIASRTELVAYVEEKRSVPMRVEEAADLRGVDILLVEDSVDNQFLIQKMLGKTGASIALADNGKVGIDMALSRPFDIILMDIQMPVMDGHDAVRTLRDSGVKSPIVALTAHAMKEERNRAMQSGFSHFLTKPISRSRLTELLVSIRYADVALREQAPL